MFQRLFLPLCAGLVLMGCSPSLNWRQVRLKPEPVNATGAQEDEVVLQALLPCKPDRATRPQRMAGYEVMVTMLGCEADGGLFAIAVAVPSSHQALMAVLAQWQTHVLASVHAQGGSRKPFPLKGADAQPEGTQLLARGRQSSGDGAALAPAQGSPGHALNVQAVWFARGGRLYHAAVYAERLSQAMTEPFFGSLAFE
ncbi:hypothetical protein DW355_02560 [Hylemonella gracilis]|uniref:Lipoprotein n=1 Tax=Hylemonella gracilis TaxID=80880 RepID=A0A4V1A2K2_9BURK|nr:hypothetical protein [Hylemonella gracilis]QBK06339.1 hypothetical protein DW355_02560 [Hylemonella gracilis]